MRNSILICVGLLMVINSGCEKLWDSKDPVVWIVEPVNNKTVIGESLTITARAYDNADVDKVEFIIDGTTLNTDETSPYSFSWDLHTLQFGSVATIQAKAYDGKGNSAVSDPVNIIYLARLSCDLIITVNLTPDGDDLDVTGTVEIDLGAGTKAPCGDAEVLVWSSNDAENRDDDTTNAKGEYDTEIDDPGACNTIYVTAQWKDKSGEWHVCVATKHR